MAPPPTDSRSSDSALVLLCLAVYVLFSLQQVVLLRWIGEGLSLGAMSIRIFAVGISLWMFAHHRVPPQLRLPLLGIGACIAALSASVAASEHPLLAFKFATRYATALALLWALLNLAVAFPAFARAAMRAALLALWINLLLAIGTYLDNPSLREVSLLFHTQNTFDKYMPRVSGFYDHPAILGATGVIVALAMTHARARLEVGRTALVFAVAGGLCALLLSGARNAVVPVLLLGAWQGWRRLRERRFGAWPGVAAVAVVGVIGIALWTRQAELSSATHESLLTRFTLGRTYLWAGAFEAWRSHPWFGLGAGVFQFLTPDFTGGRFHRGELHAHNLPLGILSETGLAGLLACGLLVWTLWRPLLQRSRSAFDRRWAGAWLVALLGFGVFDFYLPFYGFSIHCALVVAWLYSLDRTAANGRQSDRQGIGE